MTGHELKVYLSSLSIIKSIDKNMIDGIPTYWKTSIKRKLSVEIQLTRYSGQQDIFIDFTLGVNNLYASYKLKYMTLPMLIESLHGVIGDNVLEFNEWVKVELRNYKINNIINE